MRRLDSESRRAAPGTGNSFLAAMIFGIAGWLAFPTQASYQDLSVILTGTDSGAERWNTYIEKSVSGSINRAELAFGTDSLTTGSIGGGGFDVPGLGTVSVRGGRSHQDAGPDELRINRADKSGRIVKIAPAAPPKAFSAGSVLDRTSSLFRRNADSELAMVFAKPKIRGEEIRIATAFHSLPARKNLPDMVPVVAKLVTNDKTDILATAFAPSKPDYARVSPFEVLLKPGKLPEGSGRFIPPVGKNDHDWANNPLPALAFSSKEQECLARGIYFEARGEPVKGQAAVAQIILNRVRNPAYPKTICGVVFQNDDWRNQCQFSFACDGIRDRIRGGTHWEIAKEVARAVTAGAIWLPELSSSTHYHATYVRPRWAHTMKRVERIGRHIFYKTYGGGWS